MLLEKLDVPQVMPQTMAFVVDRARLAHFRQALRGVLEEGDFELWRQFCVNRRGSFINEWAQARVALDANRVRQWHALARQKDKTLPQHGLVSVPAHRYLDLIHSIDGLAGREGWALQALNALREEADDAEPELSMARDISWVRELRFGHANGRSSRTVLDPIGDEVFGLPEMLDYGDMTPLEVLELVRAQLGSRTAVDLIGTPFCDSVGPGPFLAPPTCASSLQNPEWEVLPLFEVTHRKWPLVDGHMLGGKALLQAEEEVRASKPSRQWHTNFARVDDARWEELLTEHWARCRSRFANALARAYRAHEAVLMLPNDRSKPFWAGIDWPAPPPPATWSTTPHCPRLNEAPCDLACVE